MKDMICKRFKFDYENDSTASYIVLNMSSSENILEYQIEMLNNNSCEGILRLDTRQKNDEVRLYYNITSTLTLSQFLQRKNLKEEEFINILKGITKTLLSSKEYFLYDNSFIVDEEYIYINPSNLEISMLYIPLTLDTDINNSFKSFLVDLIISSAKIDENSTGNYMQRILNYLKNDIFNIFDFHNFLKDLEKDKPKKSENRMSQPKQSNIKATNPQRNIVNSNREPKKNYEKKEITPIKHQKSRAKSAPIEIVEEEEEVIAKTKYETKYILIAVLSQIIIAITIVFGLDTIKSMAGDDISAYGGITIIVTAIDILLFKNLFKKENMKEVKVTKKIKKEKVRKKNIGKSGGRGKSKTEPTTYKKKESLNMSKREIYNVNELSNINGSYREIAASEDLSIVSVSMNETEILDDEKQGIAYLQRMNNGMMDKVTITKSNFIIGRLPNYVDYLLENNSIGRTHAEIIEIEGQYFIKDLNSKNGTFVNGAKIDSNKEYQIGNGDKVKFANIEYTFIEA
ncbi:DUF6382 domain-containing protein [Wukongibacter baidiensis]|uniref:DUF6382 domain-containing protein n=1 Tax=Wukongibacter baidiensis TaxID=1723361 RepID=UPI003D7F7654